MDHKAVQAMGKVTMEYIKTVLKPGMGLKVLTRSGILLGLVTLFQISAHWIILAEERWCIRKFGDRYREYMKRVRRYI